MKRAIIGWAAVALTVAGPAFAAEMKYCDDDVAPQRTAAPEAAEIAAHRRFDTPAIHYTGRVTLKSPFRVTVLVDAAGKVACIYGAQADDQAMTWERGATMIAAMKWRYRPFLLDGKPASALVTEAVDEQFTDTHTPMPQGRLYDTKIQLWRSPCFGTCPSYGVTIAGNGDVVFKGLDFTSVQGEVRFHISPGEAAALIERLRTRDLWSMRDDYRARVTDNPTYVIGMDIGRHRKTVTDYVGLEAGMPPEVTLMEDDIDAVSRAPDLVHLSPAGLSLEDSGFKFKGRAGANLLMRALADNDASDDAILGVINLGTPVRGGDVDLARMTIRRAYVDKPTSLDIALNFGRELAVGPLIARGALLEDGKPDQTLIDNAFQSAIVFGRLEPVELLAGYHPSLTFVDKTNEGQSDTPKSAVAPVTLLIAQSAPYDQPDEAMAVAQFLIGLGCDISGKGSDGRTLLKVAVGRDDADFVRWLLGHGADPKAVTSDGRSLLAQVESEDVALMLLEAGADPTISPEGYVNFFEDTQSKKWTRVIAWLEAHGYGEQLKANAPKTEERVKVSWSLE